jgi:hypothetical protein
MRSFAPIILLYEAALIVEALEESVTPTNPAAVLLMKFRRVTFFLLIILD